MKTERILGTMSQLAKKMSCRWWDEIRIDEEDEHPGEYSDALDAAYRIVEEADRYRYHSLNDTTDLPEENVSVWVVGNINGKAVFTVAHYEDGQWKDDVNPPGMLDKYLIAWAYPKPLAERMAS